MGYMTAHTAKNMWAVDEHNRRKGLSQSQLFISTTDADSFTKHLMISIRGMIFEWCICSCNFDLEKELLNHIELLVEGIKVNECT